MNLNQEQISILIGIIAFVIATIALIISARKLGNESKKKVFCKKCKYCYTSDGQIAVNENREELAQHLMSIPSSIYYHKRIHSCTFKVKYGLSCCAEDCRYNKEGECLLYVSWWKFWIDPVKKPYSEVKAFLSSFQR